MSCWHIFLAFQRDKTMGNMRDCEQEEIRNLGNMILDYRGFGTTWSRIQTSIHSEMVASGIISKPARSGQLLALLNTIDAIQ